MIDSGSSAWAGIMDDDIATIVDSDFMDTDSNEVSISLLPSHMLRHRQPNAFVYFVHH